MAIGRISGPLLSQNLLRNGVDLAFETDLLYLDVRNGRLGVKKTNPAYELDVNGTLNASNLKITYTGPGTGSAQIGKLTISSGTISTSVGPITIQPSGNDVINLIGDTTITGNLHATGNITSDGDITIGDNANIDNVVFNAEIKSNIIPAVDNTYDLGSESNMWASAYVDTLFANALASNGNIQIDPKGGLLEVTSDISVKGKNPIGTAPVVTNVLYVTMDGNDTNDGRAMDPSRACKTISGAVRSPYYRPGTLIRVSSGRYLENNPILLQPNTAIIGDDLRTCSIEPINKTQDLFHVQSGCYLAQMQFINGRSGLLPADGYPAGTNRGAYATAFPPLVNGKKLDVYHSPYIQNCTNQSGPWLVDGTIFVPNQTVQIPSAVGTTTFAANTNTITVIVSEGVIKVGDNIQSGPQTPGFFNARTLLLANKIFIKDQVIAYTNNLIDTATVGSPYYGFVYEKAKWTRDIGLIIENVAYDATFGGNEKSVEAGKSYYNGVINLIEGQQVQFTEAINYINELAQYIITNRFAPIVSTATNQVRNTALINGVIASDEITNGINIITSIINSGTSVAPVVFNSCGPETPGVSAEILLQANRKFLQEEVTAYVDAQYPNFQYKRDYCYRDTGLIVDAVSQDIVVGGNTKSIEAALSYFTGSKGDSSVAEQAITSNLTLIADIIVNGPAVAPAPVVGPNLGTSFSNAASLLTRNKLFLQSEVSAYVRTIITLTQQQQDLCFRDVGLIVDAIAEDTAAGGNANSVYAALQYFNGVTNILPSGEVPAFEQAIVYMITLCANIVKNIQTTNLYQTYIPQVVSLPAATLAEYDQIAINVDLITDIITLGPSAAPLPYTPISQTLTNNPLAINGFNVLTANRDFLAAEVTGYIDDVFGGGFEYNQYKCFRDTGLIVDSLAFDLLYQGNTQAIFAGSQYYNQGGYTGKIGSELSTTTLAINYARDLAAQVAINLPITPKQAISTQTFDLINVGSLASTATIIDLFNTVTNILINGTVGVTNQIVSNGDVSIDQAVNNAYALVQANKQFIQDEVIAYIDTTYESFVYDKVKCARDTGLIVKALAQDLLFDGNSQSTFAGIQYWAQSSYTGSISSELTTTTNAIKYVRDLAVKVITQDTTGPRYQSAVGQYTTGTTAPTAVTQLLYDDFNVILDILNNGTAGITDKIVSNRLTSSTDPTVINAYALLVANKDYIKTEAIAYVEATKTHGFSYDPAKCSRDVGYMIDSVGFDLLYGGNRQAVQSGVYYYGYSSTTQIPNELPQVTAAYNHIRTLASYIVSGQRVPTQYQYTIPQVLSASTGTAVQAGVIGNYIDIILNIITNGAGVANPPAPISTTASVNPNVINAATLLDLNLEFIKAEVIAYIDTTYPLGFQYNKTTCRRDVNYIVDCVCFDLLHSGNRQSIQAGVYYYGFNSESSVLTYEKTQAIAAYNHIKNISGSIIQNVALTPTPGNTFPQTILTNGGTTAEIAQVASDINIITDIINNGPSASYIKQPISLTASTSTTVVNSYVALIANREFIQNEIIAYIEYYFKAPFVFNKVKCSRDTKLIVDSLALDLAYEGNTQSKFAALQYWAQGSSAIPGEETTTTNAINYAKGLTQSYIIPTAENLQVASLFDTVVNIIVNGTAGVTDIIEPNSLPSTDPAKISVYNVIQVNKAQIQADTITWINANNPGFIYDQTKCYRDIGYILDCVSFDLLHGGNRQSIQAGVYYYGFSSTVSNLIDQVSSNPETPQTTAAYNYLKYMIKTVLLNTPITRSYQEVYPQVIDSSYMGLATVIPGEENITVDAINYLNSLSQNIISNTPVSITRAATTQTFYTAFENGAYAGPSVARNYGIISNIILNGPNASPVPYAGTGFFATTGVSSDDVRESPTVLSVTTVTTATYLVTLSGPTVGDTANGTLYFGTTAIYPAQDSVVPDRWAERRIDPTGSMGGSLVDGSVVSDRSPIQSFVYDAFTQVNQGGVGIHVTNNGYAQLVSVFTIFCSTAVLVENGGIASIVNSNSNFGDICLVAKGYGKREFSGTIYNPPYPLYQPNGEYYPNGYYPKNGLVEIYLPDVSYRPHISLVMEVEPPLGHVNEQGFPGFLNAAPSLATLTTGTITITGIDTTGIAVGNSLYIRDQYGNLNYSADGTVVVDVNYQSVTLNKGLSNGGGDPANSNFFNLYFCGNSYYTVLSSTLTDSHKLVGDRLIPGDQLGPELAAITFMKSELDSILAFAGTDNEARLFVAARLDLTASIINAVDLTTAEEIVPNPTKVGTPPVGASIAISAITANIETIVTNTIAYIVATYPGISVPTGYDGLTSYLNNKCARDIRLLLVQLIYDLETGGNYYSVYSGLSYWVRYGTHHIVNLEESVNNTALFPDGATVNFYQRSYMSASGYVFEYVGAGTNYGALPQRGVADPVQSKEVVQLNNGKVFFTSTDQNGDFRIGPGLVVSQATGVLSGRTFTKSLFANLTPFILAIEGGG